jgi:hypothetical protein
MLTENLCSKGHLALVGALCLGQDRPDNPQRIPFKAVNSANDETIASFVHHEHATGWSGVE